MYDYFFNGEEPMEVFNNSVIAYGIIYPCCLVIKKVSNGLALKVHYLIILEKCPEMRYYNAVLQAKEPNDN